MSEMIEKNEQLPAFLQDKQEDAKELKAEFMAFTRPPRVKMVQALTREPIKPPFKEGDIVITPNLIKIGDGDGMMFSFTPIHFFPSWSCLNPLATRGTLPNIREFSLDPKSTTAKKARAFHKERCPEAVTEMLEWRELLNFFILIHGVQELANTPITLTFLGGEYRTGQNFMGTCDARQVPYYAQKFKCGSEPMSGPKGQWQGWAIVKDGFIEEDLYEPYKLLRSELKQGIESAKFDLSYDTEEAIKDKEQTEEGSEPF